MASDTNKSVVRRYFEEVHNARAVDIIDDIFGPDLMPGARQVAARVTTAFPDYRIDIADQIAEGEKVVTIWSLSGTHQGVWESPMGPVEPTGRPVRFGAVTAFRLTDGRIVEVLASNHDHLGLLQQLGAVPSAAPRPGA